MGSLTPPSRPPSGIRIRKVSVASGAMRNTCVSHKFGLQPAHINLDGEFWIQIQIYTEIKRIDLLL